ncbi:MAG: PQQ-binding-like beta-propeller repeat protein [Pseudomonadota bacterium]
MFKYLTTLYLFAIFTLGVNAQEQATAPTSTDAVPNFQSGVDLKVDPKSMPGFALYEKHCASCHRGTVPKAPHESFLELMSRQSLLNSMNDGLMKTQSAGLSAQEKGEVADYLARLSTAQNGDLPKAPQCQGDAAKFDLSRPPPAIGWGHDTARFSPTEIAGLAAADIPKLKLKWAFAFPNALRARSQPSVGMGAVFVGSQQGTVYALDLETGCVRWAFEANAEVRNGIVLSTWQADEKPADPPMAFFGDIIARVYAVNALTGELIWSAKVDSHPNATLTATAALLNERLYVPVSSLEVTVAADPTYECCTFRGKVIALNARTGEVLWEHYAIPEAPAEVGKTEVGTKILAPSGAPVWNSPALDHARNLLYFGTGENYSSPADGNSDAVIAVDLDTGERRWQYQTTSKDAWNVACTLDNNPNCPEENGPDFDHGSSMILVRKPNGKDVLVTGHKGGEVYGLDPENQGKMLWRVRVGEGGIQGGVHFGMAVDGTRIYAPINDMIDTGGGQAIDPAKAQPGVHAIDAETGKVLWSHIQENVCNKDWEFCDPGVSAPVAAIPGAVFAGHLDGYLRAYDGETGKVIWEFNTAKPVKTVSGAESSGGGMSGSGPVVIDGHMITNSGYGIYNHHPGNLLMVFSVDGR